MKYTVCQLKRIVGGNKKKGIESIKGLPIGEGDLSHKPCGNVGAFLPGRGNGKCKAVWQPLVFKEQQGDQCSSNRADEVRVGHELREAMELIQAVARMLVSRYFYIPR